MADDFATKGTIQVGDAMAALAMVRALIQALEKRRALSRSAVSSIINDALAQLEGHLTSGGQEAQRLIREFHQSLIKTR